MGKAFRVESPESLAKEFVTRFVMTYGRRGSGAPMWLLREELRSAYDTVMSLHQRAKNAPKEVEALLTPEYVNELMGNSSWTHTECGECGAKRVPVVVFEEYGGDVDFSVCLSCLEGACKALRGGEQEQHNEWLAAEVRRLSQVLSETRGRAVIEREELTKQVVDAEVRVRLAEVAPLVAEVERLKAELDLQAASLKGLWAGKQELTHQNTTLTLRVQELEAFVRHVPIKTKHGPRGSGQPGPCDKDCIKCAADALLGRACSGHSIKWTHEVADVWTLAVETEVSGVRGPVTATLRRLSHEHGEQFGWFVQGLDRTYEGTSKYQAEALRMATADVERALGARKDADQ